MNGLSIQNKTKWSTVDLRKFVLAGLKAEVGTWHGTYRVVIKYRRSSSGYRGWGYYDCHSMKLMVPRPEAAAQLWKDQDKYKGFANLVERSPKDLRRGACTRLQLGPDFLCDYAKVLAHEADHNKGERGHRVIDDSARDVSWVEPLIESGFVIRLQRPTPKVKVDHQAVRATHAEDMLAEHEAKLKREQKLVRKWRKKVKYYEKAMAAKRGE